LSASAELLVLFWQRLSTKQVSEVRVNAKTFENFNKNAFLKYKKLLLLSTFLLKNFDKI